MKAITNPFPFQLSPDEIIWRMRSDWLGFIDDGHSPLLETVIPHLESEAVFRMTQEIGFFKAEAPDQFKEPESWRLWWLNEAYHHCYQYAPIGSADRGLSAVGQAAVNVFIASSELRTAIELGKTEKAAALAMLLICEAMQGGYAIDAEINRRKVDEADEKKETRILSTIGKANRDFERVERDLIKYAAKLWKDDPTLGMKEVVDKCCDLLDLHIHKMPALAKRWPDLDAEAPRKTIRKWLKDAAKAGKLTIPPAAQKPGRPSKAL